MISYILILILAIIGAVVLILLIGVVLDFITDLERTIYRIDKNTRKKNSIDELKNN